MVIETSEDNSYSSSQLLTIENETKRKILLSGSSAIFHFSPFPQSILLSFANFFLPLSLPPYSFRASIRKIFFTNSSFNENPIETLLHFNTSTTIGERNELRMMIVLDRRIDGYQFYCLKKLFALG